MGDGDASNGEGLGGVTMGDGVGCVRGIVGGESARKDEVGATGGEGLGGAKVGHKDCVGLGGVRCKGVREGEGCVAMYKMFWSGVRGTACL